MAKSISSSGKMWKWEEDGGFIEEEIVMKGCD